MRDKLNQFINLLETSDNIYIMGHKDLDLDALGASLGIYTIAKYFKKKAFIIINDIKSELSVKKVLDSFDENKNIINTKKNITKIPENSLLVVVDTNKKQLLQDPELIEIFDKVVIVDHHDKSSETISNSLEIIDTKYSSACEIISEMYEKFDIVIDEFISTITLAGIVLDTNNFIVRTTANTYKQAYFLTKNGASPIDVQYILKQDIKGYIERQKVITDVKIINHCAITMGAEDVKYRREDLAKIADTLLQFSGVEASFVIGKLGNNNVGISARALRNVHVGEVMELFNGGGDNNDAAAQINSKSIEEVYKELLTIIKDRGKSNEGNIY